MIITQTTTVEAHGVTVYLVSRDAGERVLFHHGDNLYAVTALHVDRDGNVQVRAIRQTLKGADYKRNGFIAIPLSDLESNELIDLVTNTVETTNVPAETMIHNETPAAPAQDVPWVPETPTDDLWARGETRTVRELKPGDTVEIGRRPGVVPTTTTVVEVDPVEDGTYMVYLEDVSPFVCSATAAWRVVLLPHGPVGGRERPVRPTSVRYRTRKPGHARKRRGVHR